MENKYEVYEKEKKIFEGSRAEIAEKYGCSIPNISRCLNDGLLLHKKYEIRKKGSRDKQELDYLYKHLEEYGNTTFRGNPEKYRKDLKKLGIEFVCWKSDFKDYGTHYILERTN